MQRKTSLYSHPVENVLAGKGLRKVVYLISYQKRTINTVCKSNFVKSSKKLIQVK